MKLLLDTHLALWLMSGDEKLTEETKALIQHPDNEVYYSIVSVWEISIKNSIHPDKMLVSGKEFSDILERSKVRFLPLRKAHVFELRSLRRREGAKEHRDPFDRMLLCQAKSEGMTLLTHDQMMIDYEEDCLICV